MRELKFRCWNWKSKELIYSGEKYLEAFFENYYEGDNFEQYIGLKDKNGKERYEGDLIKCYTQEGYPVGEVIYSETWIEYEIVGYDKEKRFYSLEHFGIATNGYLEVIGNIHENGELLGGEE